MREVWLRAAACALIAPTLAGCALPLSTIGAGILGIGVGGPALAVLHQVKHLHGAPAKSPQRRGREHVPAPYALGSETPPHVDPYSGERGSERGSYSILHEEMRAGITCPRKRLEFLAVYRGTRPLPPQLECGPHGEFGMPRVYGPAPVPFEQRATQDLPPIALTDR